MTGNYLLQEVFVRHQSRQETALLMNTSGTTTLIRESARGSSLVAVSRASMFLRHSTNATKRANAVSSVLFGLQRLLLPDFYVDTFCKEPVDIGPCRNNVQKYHFDWADNSCKPLYYKGCFGNNNNFASQRSCEKICRCKHIFVSGN